MSLAVPEPLTPALALDGVAVYHADCLVALRALPDCSVDSIVCDPPYEIGFMGKAWDGTGIAYSVGLWAECLRVLKPGGHLLAFGATRSYHRMAVAIEDAGFEIRDSIHWTYGSGFPKSLDVSKAIDKQAGAEREVVGSKRVHPKGVSGAETRTASSAGAFGGEAKDVPITAPATSDAATWQGWGTALKPSHEPIVVARRPLVGTVAQTVLAHGTGALNIDACRVGTDDTRSPASLTALGQGSGWNAHENRVVMAGSASGRWPANTVLTHAAGCRASEGGETTVPLFACVPGCPIAELDRQSGVLTSGARAAGTYDVSYTPNAIPNRGPKPALPPSSGGASRFFTCTEWSDTWDAPAFLYVAKPAKKERNAGLDGLPQKAGTGDWPQALDPGAARGSLPQANHHPTVKPVALMRHLVRLVTPPGGVVLDPFLGSGTTAVAAILEGAQFVGCEMTAEYLPIIEGRVRHAVANRPAPPVDLFSEEAP